MGSQHKKLPAYCTTSVGPPGLRNVAIRLRDLAAFLAAQGFEDVAEQVSRAYGGLQAYLAVPIQSKSRHSAGRTSDGIGGGLQEAGAAADRGINGISRLPRWAANEAGEAMSTAGDVVGRAALKSGEAVEQAG